MKPIFTIKVSACFKFHFKNQSVLLKNTSRLHYYHIFISTQNGSRDRHLGGPNEYKRSFRQYNMD